MRLAALAVWLVCVGMVEAQVNSGRDEIAKLRESGASPGVVRNEKVVVRFGADGAWDAAWADVDSGVFRAGFSISVDAKVLKCKGGGSVGEFKDALGQGQVVREAIS